MLHWNDAGDDWHHLHRIIISSCAHNHRTMQAGRDLGTLLVQPATPSRVKAEYRPGCSGFCLVWSWKIPRMGITQPLWTIVKILNHPHSDHFSSSEHLYFSLSKTGQSIPGAQEWPIKGNKYNTTFPWRSWSSPACCQPTSYAESSWQLIRHGWNYRTSRPSKAASDIAQHHPPSTLPLCLEKWAQSFPPI